MLLHRRCHGGGEREERRGEVERMRLICNKIIRVSRRKLLECIDLIILCTIIWTKTTCMWNKNDAIYGPECIRKIREQEFDGEFNFYTLWRNDCVINNRMCLKIVKNY